MELYNKTHQALEALPQYHHDDAKVHMVLFFLYPDF